MIKYCCVTGHRPKGFPFKYGVDEKKHNAYLKLMREQIETAIDEYGVTNFISGMALGVDMDFAEIVIHMRDVEHYPITLEAAVPCPNQAAKWSEEDKKRYDRLISGADVINILSDSYTRDCMLKRNRYMVDKSYLVIEFFNAIPKGGTWYTIKYADKKKKLQLYNNLNLI